MNDLNNFDRTYREYSLSSGVQRLKVKVTAGRGEGIHVDAGASTFMSKVLCNFCIGIKNKYKGFPYSFASVGARS